MCGQHGERRGTVRFREEAIEEALDRRAEREADKIRVETTDGTVTLTGVVRSWGEKQAVIASARYAKGVRAVNDRLTVNPYI